jgi:hypothetical protein
MEKDDDGWSPSHNRGPEDAFECRITILRCVNGFATKEHTANGTNAYNMGSLFTGEVHTIRSISDWAALTHELDDRHFMVRGRIDPALRSSTFERNQKTLLGQPLPFLVLDFDGVPNPERRAVWSTDAIERLRLMLPSEFHDAECHYTVSSSAGLAKTPRDDVTALRAHLRFCLDRPITDLEAKAWVGDIEYVDLSLFSPEHAHYFAPPRFSGVEDPVPTGARQGQLEGLNRTVCVPIIDVEAYERRASVDFIGKNGLRRTGGFAQRLKLIGDHKGGGGAHVPIRGAIASYVVQHGPETDLDALVQAIQKRVAETHWQRDKRPEGYLERESSRAEIERSARGMLAKLLVAEVEEPPTSGFLTMTEGRTRNKAFAERFADAAISWNDPVSPLTGKPLWKSSFFKRDIFFGSPPPVFLNMGQAGSGKSESFFGVLPRLAATMKRGAVILIAVPTHALSSGLARRVEKATGLKARILRGAGADDPDAPGHKMCRIPDVFNNFRALGLGKSLCDECKHRPVCGYQKQPEQRKTAQIVIVAHQTLVRKRVSRMLEKVDYLIIEEDAVDAGAGNGVKVKIDDLVADGSKATKAAFEALGSGKELERSMIGIGDHALRRMRAAAEKSKTESADLIEMLLLKMHGDMKRAAAEAEAASGVVDRFRMLTHMIENPGEVLAMKVIERKGDRVLVWDEFRRIHTDFMVPTLICDATGRTSRVEAMLPISRWDSGAPKSSMLITEKFAVEMPHARHRLVRGFSGAVSRFTSTKGPDAGQRATLDRLMQYVAARMAGRRKGLLFVSKAVRKLIDVVPPGVTVLHHGATRGVDDYGDVDLVVTVGRIGLKPADAEGKVRARTLKRVRACGGSWYGWVWTKMATADGLGVWVSVERHPDRAVNQERASKAEDELEQGIARARPSNRTADNPVQIDVIAKINLPGVAYNEVVDWSAGLDVLAVVEGRFGLALEKGDGLVPALMVLTPDLCASERTTKRLVAAAQITKPAGRAVAVKVAAKRAVIRATAVRPGIWRPTQGNEDLPRGADMVDGCVLVYGSAGADHLSGGQVIVLEKLPRDRRRGGARGKPEKARF